MRAEFIKCFVAKIIGIKPKDVDTQNVISVIGDGSISNGLAYEALNHIGDLGKNIMTNQYDNGIDTTHQFIRVPIYVTIANKQELAGTALFYNHNYGK